MSNDKNTPSIAAGHPLTKETFDDFIKRLYHDCRGEGVSRHHTAHAVFLVEEKRMITGLDAEYGERLLYDCTGDFCHWLSPLEYWQDLEEEEMDELDIMARNWADDPEATFLGLEEDSQWDVLSDKEGVDIGYYQWQWKPVNYHLTRDAAEAFIRRKSHDYGELRVYVDSSYWGWELNTIRDALMDGRLVLKEEKDENVQ